MPPGARSLTATSAAALTKPHTWPDAGLRLSRRLARTLRLLRPFRFRGVDRLLGFLRLAVAAGAPASNAELRVDAAIPAWQTSYEY